MTCPSCGALGIRKRGVCPSCGADRRTPREVRKEPVVLLPNARSDLTDFFKKTNVLTERRPHHQFLVFVTSRNAVAVHIVDAARKLVDFPPESTVMVQWPGKWRSDWFRTTAGEVLRAKGLIHQQELEIETPHGDE